MKALLECIGQSISIITKGIIQLINDVIIPLRFSLKKFIFESIDDITIAFWPICGIGVIMGVIIAATKYIKRKWF